MLEEHGSSRSTRSSRLARLARQSRTCRVESSQVEFEPYMLTVPIVLGNAPFNWAVAKKGRTVTIYWF